MFGRKKKTKVHVWRNKSERVAYREGAKNKVIYYKDKSGKMHSGGYPGTSWTTGGKRLKH